MAFLYSKGSAPPAKALDGGGGRPPTSDWPGGDGGGRGGGGDDFPSYRERLLRYRMLVGFLLASVTVIFVVFTTAYVVRKAGVVWDPAHGDFVGSWVPTTLPVKLLLFNTFLLFLSSLTLEVSRRRAAEDVVLAPIADIPGIRVGRNRTLSWLWLTIVLGLGFLSGQYLAWAQLRLGHVDLGTNISLSFFFVLTGLHAAHLIGGILALLYAGLTSWLRRPPETRRIVMDVTAWYWHFMGILWVYVFGLLYFGR